MLGYLEKTFNGGKQSPEKEDAEGGKNISKDSDSAAAFELWKPKITMVSEKH